LPPIQPVAYLFLVRPLPSRGSGLNCYERKEQD
jgi:hypothetical protein